MNKRLLTDEEIEKKYNCTKTRNSSHYALVKIITEDQDATTTKIVAEEIRKDIAQIIMESGSPYAMEIALTEYLGTFQKKYGVK